MLVTEHEWMTHKVDENRFMHLREKGEDFIPAKSIEGKLLSYRNPSPQRVREIISKSLDIQTLSPDEVAVLLNVTDPDLWSEMQEAALVIKKKVYDNRIVTFAPLYMGNYCVNNCQYCGFKSDNKNARRKVLSDDEIRKEIEALAGRIGHKRLIVVYGEHPKNDVDYIISSIKTVYDTRVTVNGRPQGIRRVNVNAPPFCIDDLRRIKEAGIGTYQVFQETYHRPTYERVHPQNTIKGDYLWRLYCMHRAFEAGIDDVGIGVLFGLYDWRFEVMGLVYHALELEKRFGVGPHTVSFPRLEPALNTSVAQDFPYRVSDEDFKKIITVIRLAIPYTGMIVTAREGAQIRREALALGVTQLDADSKIEIGAYANHAEGQKKQKQQFLLNDTRSLEAVIQDLARLGHIVSFCTAGYRCGRTGNKIMYLLRSGKEGKFCKLNAILTYKEWIDDFAGEETRKIAEPLIQKEIAEVKKNMPQAYEEFKRYYQRITQGERDLFL